MKSPLNLYRSRGVTLIELMIVVVIVAILAAVGYPMYQDQVLRARRTDGKAALMDMAARMERYYFDHNSYTTDLRDVGYAVATDAPSDDGHYTLAAAPDPATTNDIASSFLLTATPAGAHSDPVCGNLTLAARGVRGNSAGAPEDRCW